MVVALGIGACGGFGEGVHIHQASADLWVGESLVLAATVVGSADASVTWASSDRAVASIDDEGVVMGVGQGSAVISATSVANPRSSARIVVTVTPLPIGSPMRLQVDTGLIAGTPVTLPLRERTTVIVAWGDGRSSAAGTSGDLQHTYEEDGRYAIEIRGRLGQFGDPGVGEDGPVEYPHAGALTAVADWGDLGLTSLTGAFAEAVSLTSVPEWLPATVTDLSWLFVGATAFDGAIGDWDTRNVTNMAGMFAGASAFNQPIGRWNTSKLTSMFWMFGAASAFNQPIGVWDLGRVRDMTPMFSGARAFDQPIGAWDTSSVTDMGHMFSNAWVFDQDLSGWCVTAIPREPENFALGAGAWARPRPAWGTRPNAGGAS